MSAPNPIRFSAEELDVIADALRDYSRTKVRDICSYSVTAEEKAMSERQWNHSEEALRKVRSA